MGKKLFISLVLLSCLFFPLISFAETIVLKSGKTVEGKIIEKTDKYMRINIYGVLVTYFLEEIESVDGMNFSF